MQSPDLKPQRSFAAETKGEEEGRQAGRQAGREGRQRGRSAHQTKVCALFVFHDADFYRLRLLVLSIIHDQQFTLTMFFYHHPSSSSSSSHEGVVSILSFIFIFLFVFFGMWKKKTAQDLRTVHYYCSSFIHEQEEDKGICCFEAYVGMNVCTHVCMYICMALVQ